MRRQKAAFALEQALPGGRGFITIRVHLWARRSDMEVRQVRLASRLRSWVAWCVVVAGVLHVVGDFQAHVRERTGKRSREQWLVRDEPREVGQASQAAEPRGSAPSAAPVTLLPQEADGGSQAVAMPPTSAPPVEPLPAVVGAAAIVANGSAVLSGAEPTEAGRPGRRSGAAANAAGEVADAPPRGDGNPPSKAAAVGRARAGREENWAAIRRELVARGVTDYRLETRGGVGNIRFTCSVPSGKNRFVSRRFEATGDDDLKVVQDVLRQVAEWQAELEKK